MVWSQHPTAPCCFPDAQSLEEELSEGGISSGKQGRRSVNGSFPKGTLPPDLIQLTKQFQRSKSSSPKHLS